MVDPGQSFHDFEICDFEVLDERFCVRNLVISENQHENHLLLCFSPDYMITVERSLPELFLGHM